MKTEPAGRASPAILCVGAAVSDTVYGMESLPKLPGKYLPTKSVEIAAGMASTAAIAAARLGAARAAICASVGDDHKGNWIVSEFEKEGIDCTFIRKVTDAPTAHSTILVDDQGERIIVPAYAAKLLADVDQLPLERISDFDVVLADVRWPAAAVQWLKAARRAGVPSVLDADVAPLEVLEALVPMVDYCVFSEPASLSYTGADSVEEALRKLGLRHPDAFMAITAGAEGCWWIDQSTRELRNLKAPTVQVVDTLSAGDVFHGAFALGIAEKRAIEDIVDRANVAAALKCMRFGGRLGSPLLAELQDYLDKRTDKQ